MDDNGIVISHIETYDEDKKEFYCAGGTVRYSYGNIMSNNISETTKTASVDAFTSAKLEADKADKAYYIYIKVNPNSTSATATFLMSETAQEYEQGSYLYLLLGILGKEQTGHRQWVPMYGYTEITPNRIRVDNIVSSDGKTYFNLLKNEIGGCINFKDGLVSGMIGVGKDGKIRAGISGEDQSADAVLFWSGAAEKNKGRWQVKANGDVYQEGNISQRIINISSDIIENVNFSDLIVEDKWDRKYIDITRFASLKSTIIINRLPSGISGILLPSFYKGRIPNTLDVDIMNFVGNVIRIVSYVPYLRVEGAILMDVNDNYSRRFTVVTNDQIDDGMERVYRCDVGWDEQEINKVIGWNILYQGEIVDV